MSTDTIWKLEDHTAAKHEILKRYLSAWFPILAGSPFNGRLVLIDGFAGPGVYADGEPGSPIIILDTLVNHSLFHRHSRTEFVLVFVEQDQNRFSSLKHQVAQFWRSHDGQPTNVKVHVVHSDFADTTERILAGIASKNRNLAPTFAFVDPFGWKGVGMDLICRLLAFDRCEVFFNLMYDSFNRFVTGNTAQAVKRQIVELYGTENCLNVDGLPPDKRRRFLHELYETQLRTVGGFDYVRRFEMIREDGHNVSTLFHGTRSLTGLRVMKDAMWKVDKVNGMRFSDRDAGMSTLFGDEPNYQELRRLIVERFGGGGFVSIPEIEKFVLVDTPFASTHYKKQVLKPLQLEGLLEVQGQRSKGTFPDRVTVRVLPA